MGVPPVVWQQVIQRREKLEHQRSQVQLQVAPAEVLALVDQRQTARQRKDWVAADDYRKRITELGWQVQDTPEGPKVEPI